MGCYETVYVPCPSCGEPYPAQSKSGPCQMDTYDLHEAPPEVLQDVNRHAPFECEKCGEVFAVQLEVRAAAVKWTWADDSDQTEA
jgi:hypothetical protein